jgi:hypothetical protein
MNIPSARREPRLPVHELPEDWRELPVPPAYFRAPRPTSSSSCLEHRDQRAWFV